MYSAMNTQYIRKDIAGVESPKQSECLDKHLKDISRLCGGIVLLYIEGRAVD